MAYCQEEKICVYANRRKLVRVRHFKMKIFFFFNVNVDRKMLKVNFAFQKTFQKVVKTLWSGNRRTVWKKW